MRDLRARLAASAAPTCTTSLDVLRPQWQRTASHGDADVSCCRALGQPVGECGKKQLKLASGPKKGELQLVRIDTRQHKKTGLGC